VLQTEGVGTIRFNNNTYDDDGGLSSDAGNSDDEGEFADVQEDNLPAPKPNLDVQIPAKPPQLVIHASDSPGTPTQGDLLTALPTVAEPTPKPSAGFSVPTPRFMPKMKLGRKFLSTAPASPAPVSPAIDAQGVPVPSAPPTRNKFVRNWSSSSLSIMGSGNESPSTSSTKLKSDFKFQGANDIVGIVLLEIQSASDLPRLNNSAFKLSLFLVD
jgi:phosphatidylserine decarboxylase